MRSLIPRRYTALSTRRTSGCHIKNISALNFCQNEKVRQSRAYFPCRLISCSHLFPPPASPVAGMLNSNMLYTNTNKDNTGGSFRKNFLLINAQAPFSEIHQTACFSKPTEDADWSEVPTAVKGKTWIGLRTVMRRGPIHIMVKIEEMYPVTGRIWYNFYNNGSWSGWKNIVPS